MAAFIEFDDSPASYISFIPGSTIVKRLARYSLAYGIKKATA